MSLRIWVVAALPDRQDVVEAMLLAAQNDPASSVRACCCQCLGQMKVRSPECLAVLQALATDAEMDVRTAACNARPVNALELLVAMVGPAAAYKLAAKSVTAV